MTFLVPAFVFVIAIAMGATASVQVAPPLVTSAWLFPLFVSAAMATVSAVLLGGEIARRRTVAAGPEGEARTAIARATPARIAGWLALSAGYAIVTPQVGFGWATGTFLIVALKVFGGASWRLTLPVALGMALIVPLIFRHVFSALIP